jgi:hypothetical protein
LGIIGILARGVGFIPQSAWAHFEKDENLFEIIWASKVVYAKPLKVARGARNWTLESNKRNQAKEMDVVSKYHNCNYSWAVYFHTFYIKKTLFAF